VSPLVAENRGVYTLPRVAGARQAALTYSPSPLARTRQGDGWHLTLVCGPELDALREFAETRALKLKGLLAMVIYAGDIIDKKI
jgi:hypothetical protein